LAGLKNWLKKKSFLLGLVGVVLLAFLWPDPASDESGFLQTELTTKLGVALIFFFQGLSLATRQMLSGCRPLKLHAFSLSWNFILYPAVVSLLLLPLSPVLNAELALGLWMLSILPTTIASATTFTSIAGGAVSPAIFMLKRWVWIVSGFPGLFCLLVNERF